ncbi:hypothetical protein [Dendronalium sp. ChiSLP03b]|uniref:hypothetical protein n=1 Tax=Dendronalium sp. ChiSLP03b TaxID=3075381 RepID=UPI003919B5CF
MCQLLSDEKLSDLTEEFHVLQGEVPHLIQLLWQVRRFKEDVCHNQRLLKAAQKMDSAISYEIIQQLDHQEKVRYMKNLSRTRVCS